MQCPVLITCAVADASVFDDEVTVQDAESLDLLLEVLHCGLFVGLQLLHSNQLACVIAQWVITAKFHTAKVSLLKLMLCQWLMVAFEKKKVN